MSNPDPHDLLTPIEMQPIGVVRNGITDAVDRGWGAVESRIELRPDLVGALEGLETFSHALVLTWLHEAPPPPGLRRRPQGRAEFPELGILAQRARYRPNPIAVSAVPIVAVEPGALIVRGLDVIDGTPVLDLKPYVGPFDRVETPRVPDWARRLYEEESYF
jgi:tRNA-Thr(GGU) m(6)t(6)A37 methyltransferase TsaA